MKTKRNITNIAFAGLGFKFNQSLTTPSASFPRFAWECIPGRFASAFRQAMTNLKSNSAFAFLFIVFLFVGLGWRPALAEPLRADVAVEKNTVFTGEPFIFQIQVSGSENPDKPDVSGISDFTVEYRGGQQNSSSSITIINGKMTRDVRKGYVFSYRLTPKRPGRLLIPPVTVHAGQDSVRTSAVAIQVDEPAESDDFKLRLKLSKNQCYVGEPVALTVAWYLGEDVRGFDMTLPILDDTEDFYFADPEVDTGSGGKFYRLPLSGGEVIAEKGQGRLDGKDYATITFKKIMIPKKSGHVSIQPATVVSEVLAGYRRGRSSFGNDFFRDFLNDDFFSGRQGVYRKVAVLSNELSLTVSEVPQEGKPANFAGHVGEYSIETEASPTDVSVGDPITLKIALRGPEYLEHVGLPPLNQQAELEKNFKIPDERAVGETSGKTKVFTQTIRPLRPGITEIPPVELPYFDTRTGTYQIAKSAPIPLSVKAAKVVTAKDAEGAALPPTASANDVETWTKGIAFNYEDPSVIENQPLGFAQWLKSPAVLGMTAVPPVVFFVLLFAHLWKVRLHGDPAALRSRRAYGRLANGMKDARSHAASNGECYRKILDALRQYLGDKLDMPGGALTFNDVKQALEARGLNADAIDRLKEIFDRCEAGRYAGCLSDEADPSALIEQSETLAKLLEKKLR